MAEKKLFSLDYVDAMFKKINIHYYCDGDKPSNLSGVSLAVCDSNLPQHGEHFLLSCYLMQLQLTVFAHTEVSSY